MIKEKKYRGFRVGLVQDLPDKDLDTIIDALSRPISVREKILGGRGFISAAQLSSGGPVVIKHYRRGGLLSRMGIGRYLKMGPSRPQRECDLLMQVKELGVSVPEPLAFVTKGGLFYKGWLVTREISKEQSLAELSVLNEKRARPLVEKLATQIALLIRNSIYHVDLHAGNVLVDPQDKLFLIDFDKAKTFRGGANKLRDNYLCRWRRAVIKHDLPEFLSEILCMNVRLNFERVESE